MVRTQVYLSEAELTVLTRTETETGASRSELIRRAVQSAYGDDTVRDGRLEALKRGVGLWKRRDTSGAEYVDGVRSDLNDRLTHIEGE